VQVGALLDLGDLFLCDSEALSHFDLGHLAGAAEFLEGHLFGDQNLGELLDLAAAGCGEGFDDFVDVSGQDLWLSYLNVF
jgi:hypothetical protein